jgi:hypothetical protein
MKNYGIMPYEICEECSGYYELQKGESPDDFELCQCGEKLSYSESIDEIPINA